MRGIGISSLRKCWRYWPLAVVVVVLLAPPALNEACRRIGETSLASLTQGEAAIGEVRVGFRKWQVNHVAAWSPNCDEPLLAVENVTANFSVWNGIRRGIWFEKIVVDGPEVQLHFDEFGQLISKLPISDPADTSDEPTAISSLPFRFFDIQNARLVVHQVGRNCLDIGDVGLRAEAVGSQLSITAEIPELFDGSLELRSQLELTTLDAETTIRLSELRVTSEQLASLPLIPPSANARPWSAAASLNVTQSGSVSEFDQLQLRVQLHDGIASLPGNLSGNGQGNLQGNSPGPPPIVHVGGVIELQQNRVAMTISGDALGGDFESTVRATLQADGVVGNVSLRCSELRTDSLPTDLIPAEVVGQLSLAADINAAFAQGILQLRGQSRTSIAETQLYGVAVAPTTVDLQLDGAVDLDASSLESENRSSGMLTALVQSEGVSLEQLRNEPHALPASIQPAGQVRGVAKLQIPFASIADPATYLVQSNVDATGVVVNDLVVRDGRGSFTMDAGQASLRFHDVRLYDRIQSQESLLHVIANTSLSPESDVQAEVRIDRLAAATLARLAGANDGRVAGELFAHAVARCSVDRITQLEDWRGQLQLQARSVRVDDQLVAHCEALGELQQGRATLQSVAGHFVGGQLAGNAEFGLLTPFPFHADVELRGAKVGQLARIANHTQPPPATGSLDLILHAGGEVATSQWQANGIAQGSGLRFGSRPFDDTQLDFVATPDVVSIQAPKDGFLGGDLAVQLTGLAGLIQLSTESSQELTTDQRLVQPKISGQAANIPLPAIARVAGIRERVEGLLSGEFVVTSFTDLASMQANVMLESPAVAIADARLQQVRTRLTLQAGEVHTQLTAAGLGGQVQLDANASVDELSQLSSEAWQNVSTLPIFAKATMTDVALQELWPMLGQQNELRPLGGKMSATFERGPPEREQGSVATGDLQLRNLRWNGVLWSNQLRADVVLGERLLEVRELAGAFASGRIHGRARVALDASRNGSFEISASRLALKKLLVPIDRRGELASGQLSVRVQGRLGARPSGRAHVSMDRGTVGPIALAGLRVPIDWSVDPQANMVQWRTNNAGLELGGGRVVTNAKGRWNGKLDMTLATSIRRVDTGRILHGSPASGTGYLDGTLRLKAKRATKAEDFTGTFKATLSDADSIQLPVLSDLTKFLKTLPTTTSFDESQIEGRLGNGIVRLERVSLAAANAQILAEGTATLQGRLNLQVMARTDETGPADKLLALADSPLLMAAPTPLALVAKANNVLKDRVVHLRIGGTASRPIIRLEPGRQLGQEAIKFFMNQTIARGNSPHELSF